MIIIYKYYKFTLCCVCVVTMQGTSFELLLFNHLFLLYFSITIYTPCTLFHLHPLSSTHNHHTVVHIHEFLFFFCSIPPGPAQPSPSQELSSCSPSMSLSLFCLLVEFVHQIPPMSEIVWYVSFSDRLISLSIMFSRSMHVVTKSKIFFSFYSQVVFPCINIPQLFYPLIY